jgi:hypothetical protein
MQAENLSAALCDVASAPEADLLGVAADPQAAAAVAQPTAATPAQTLRLHSSRIWWWHVVRLSA